MPVVLPVVLMAAAAILGGVTVVAMGRGGELARPAADVRPMDTDIVTAADVALLRPPAALWGYDKRATDEALDMIARTVTERDVEIASLRSQLAEMQSGKAGKRDQAEPGTAGRARPWSAWDRPSPSALPDYGERPETGHGGRP